MANAIPVHKPEGTDTKKKPLSKDAQKIKAELEQVKETPEVVEAPAGVELPDGTVRKDF